MEKQLESPQELAKRIGVPVSNVRYLIQEQMIDHIYTAPGQRNPKVPFGAWERYLDNYMVRASSENHNVENIVRSQKNGTSELVKRIV